MTLKASLVANNIKVADMIIWFAKDHNYSLAIDEETVWHTVNQRQPGKAMEGNYNILKMLIVQDITFEKITNNSKVKKVHSLNSTKKTIPTAIDKKKVEKKLSGESLVFEEETIDKSNQPKNTTNLMHKKSHVLLSICISAIFQ